jgi:hypothetical protein
MGQNDGQDEFRNWLHIFVQLPTVVYHRAT